MLLQVTKLHPFIHFIRPRAVLLRFLHSAMLTITISTNDPTSWKRRPPNGPPFPLHPVKFNAISNMHYRSLQIDACSDEYRWLKFPAPCRVDGAQSNKQSYDFGAERLWLLKSSTIPLGPPLYSYQLSLSSKMCTTEVYNLLYYLRTSVTCQTIISPSDHRSNTSTPTQTRYNYQQR